MQRKLTVILAADVVGYIALMERDEAGTLAHLQENRRHPRAGRGGVLAGGSLLGPQELRQLKAVRRRGCVYCGCAGL